MKKLSVFLVVLAFAGTPALASKRLDEAVKKAEEQLLKNKPEDAVKTMRKAVSKEPTDPETYAELGRILLRVGSRDEAGAAFAEGAQVAGGASGVAAANALAALADYELLRGPAAKALGHAEAAVKAEANVASLSVLARAQARMSQRQAALATAKKALSAAPSSPVALQAQCEALVAADRTDDGVAACRKATELAPESIAAKVALARALLAQGRPDDAIQVARAATEAAPKSAEAFAALGTATFQANDANWGDAIGHAQQGAFLDPQSPFVLYAVGELFEAQQNYDQALVSYRDALDVDPHFSRAARKEVTVLWQKGQPKAALKAARERLAQNPNDGPLALMLGELLLRGDDFAGALDPLEKAIKLLPDSADAQYFLALAYTRTGKSQDEAAKLFCKAVDLDPANLDYRVACGLALVRGEDSEQRAVGVQHLEKVVANPKYDKPDAWINLGYAYLNLEPPKPAQAVEAYKKGLARVGADQKDVKIQALIGLARALGEADMLDEAIETYQKVVKLDPSYEPSAWVRILMLEYKRDVPNKDFTRTEAALKKAAALNGDDNPIVVRVRETLEQYKKNIEAPQQPMICDISVCVRTLQSKASAGAKKKALNDLKAYGRDGAEYIASYGLYYQRDMEVREAAVKTLTSMGRNACPGMESVVQTSKIEVIPAINPTRDEALAEIRLLDLIKSARVLAGKLQGICK